MTVKVASIRGFSGHPLSGLWHIHLNNGDFVHIESGFGIGQMVECFGNLKNAVGKRIRYSVDWLGVMEWFQPVGKEGKA